jgi:hypothetical protein
MSNEVKDAITLDCAFNSVNEVFKDNVEIAKSILSDSLFEQYCKNTLFLARIGQGDKPSIAVLETMHFVGQYYGDGSIDKIIKYGYDIVSKSPNKKCLSAFIYSFKSLMEHTKKEQLDDYLELIQYLLKQTTISIHGIHDTHPSPSFEPFLANINTLVEQLDFDGIRVWIDYGLRYFKHHPQKQEEYFTLTTADSRAVLQRQRKGLLFEDVEISIDYFQEALFSTRFTYAPYSPDFEKLQHFHPYLEDDIIRLPDIYQDSENTKAYDRYIALVSHLMAHHKYSTKIIADNFSPQQRMFAEVFEDARVEYLLLQEYPGLKKIWKSLIPIVDENDCDDINQSCLRHRAIMLSRALIDDNHPYKNKHILEFVAKFKELMQKENTTKDSANLGLYFLTKTRLKSDALPKMYFDNTEISYRDDNRCMWVFIEEDDEGEEIYSKTREQSEDEGEELKLIPHFYDEYDYLNESYKLDWVSVYESLHPSGDSTKIDRLLEKNSSLAKQLKKIFDLLKPQNKKRVRFQEDGSELDLDIAIKSVIDIKNAIEPETRINISYEHDNRSVSVLLLLDLSQSLNDRVENTNSTILELSQEAVSLLAWAIEQLGDNFAIAGFNSNTRDKVMYYHIKGYNESFDDSVKARLSAIKAEFSTRMGAAIRHGSHYLSRQKSDKKIMLILTDGEPADIDISDEQVLIVDTHKAVAEASQKGIYPYCISLDKKADEYISDIFASHYSIIDKIELLPKKLPQLFLSLTK